MNASDKKILRDSIEDILIKYDGQTFARNYLITKITAEIRDIFLKFQIKNRDAISVTVDIDDDDKLVVKIGNFN